MQWKWLWTVLLENYLDIITNMENYVDAIIVLDEKANVVFVNNYYQDATPMEEKSLIGRNLFDIYPDMDPSASTIMKALTTGESTINYTLRFWVKTDDYWAALFAVNQKIKEDFDAAGVKMSFPHLNVHIDK